MCGRISCADPELGGRYKYKPYASRASKLGFVVFDSLIQNVIGCVAGLAALILSRGSLQTQALRFSCLDAGLCCFYSAFYPHRADKAALKQQSPFCFQQKRLCLSGWQDSNLRPPGPKPGAIPGYATPRKSTMNAIAFRLLTDCKDRLFMIFDKYI